MIKRYPFLWILGFTVLFMLSLDFWRWSQAVSLGGLNFPSWLPYFVGLNAVLALTMYGFSRWDSQGGQQ